MEFRLFFCIWEASMDDGAIDQSSVTKGVRKRRRRFQILSNQAVGVL